MADVAIPSSGGGAFVVGTYTGDGNASQTILLGFTPSAVIVTYNGGRFADGPVQGGIVTKGHPVVYGSDQNLKILEIVDGGFKAYTSTKTYLYYANGPGERYYIAFR